MVIRSGTTPATWTCCNAVRSERADTPPGVSRRRMLHAAAGLGALLALGSLPDSALAAGKKSSTSVAWTKVEVPPGDRRRARESMLRKVLGRESRDADWGEHKSGRIEASVSVVEFAVERRDDVVRVTCTALGKLAGGPSVRTHFSIGDHPSRQVKLETMVLTLVARGIVTRLSAIARKRAS